MANITEFTNPDAARGLQIPNGGAEAFGQAGYHVARIAHQIGEDATEVQGAIDQHEQLQQHADATQKSSDLMDTVYGNGDGSWKQFHANGGTLDDYKTILDEQYQHISDGITNEKVRTNFADTKADQVATMVRSFAVDEANTAGVKAVDAQNNSVESTAKILATHPELADKLIPQTLKGAHQAFQIAAVDNTATAGFDEKASARMAQGAIDGIIENATGPNATAAQITAAKTMITNPDGAIYKAATQQQIYDASKRLDTIADSQDNIASAVAKTQVPTWTGQVRAGDPEAYQALTNLMSNPPGKTEKEREVAAAEIGTERDKAAKYFTVTQGLRSMPQPDAEAAVAGLDTREPDNMALKDFVQTRAKEYAAAPAEKTMSEDPVTNAAFSNYTQQPTPQNFQKYLTASSSWQDKFFPATGANPIPHQLIPAALRGDISTKLRAAEQNKEGSAALVGNELSTLKTLAGPQYTDVVHELLHSQILRPGEYAAANMMTDPHAAPLVGEALHADGMSKTELDTASRLSGNAADALARNAMAPLADTFKGWPTDEVDAYTTSLANMLRVRSIGSHVPDADEAAGLAQRMVSHNYTLTGNLRIPASMDAIAITGGVRQTLDGIGSRDLIVPPSTLGKSASKDVYAGDIQRNGEWTTNSAGDGAMLFDGTGAPVYERGLKGIPRPVTVLFKDAATLGNTHASPGIPGGPVPVANSLFQQPGKI